jgi:O-antigen ligase
MFFWHPKWINVSEFPDRFSALSSNPNQLALFLLPIPFFSAFCYLKGAITFKIMLLLTSLTLLINFYVLGKALFVGWLLALFFLYLNNMKFFEKTKISLRLILRNWFFVFFVALLMIPIFLLLYSGNIPGGQAGQGDVRIQLWAHGLQAWSDAFLLGNGPGHFSGVKGPYEGVEAHNLLIDWASAYGFISLTFLVTFFLLVIYKASKNYNKLIIALLITLILQMTFHFYARQPVFWIWWIIAFIVAEKKLFMRINS